jgi:hypothetical protein
VEAFTNSNNEYQLRDFKAAVELTDELYCNDTNNKIRALRNLLSFANHVGGIVPKGNLCRILLALLFELRSSNNGGSPITPLS